MRTLAPYRAVFGFALVALFLIGNRPAMAVTGSDSAPGEACTVADSTRVNAKPSGSGSYVLTCEGGVWTADFSARLLLMEDGGAETCNAASEGAIRYNSAGTIHEYCNGTSWSSFGGGLSADSVLESHLKAVDTPTDEECLTYEATVGDFEWQSCGGAGGGLWSDSGSGYIEYNSSYGGILVGGMTGLAAPAMP